MQIIRTRAPMRLGFAGGGSDLKIYSNKFGGAVLNATISIYVNCSIFENKTNRITFESIDSNIKGSYNLCEKIDFDGKLDLYKAVYNRIIKEFNPKLKNFYLSTYSEAPVGSGLGGSSTLVVSIISAFKEFFNIPIEKKNIAKLAYSIEREDMLIVGGQQDQYSASFGGFNFIKFFKNGNVSVNPLKISKNIVNDFECSIILYNTKLTRYAGQIEKEKTLLLKKNESIGAMHEVKNSAYKMKDLFLKGNIIGASQMLDKSWAAKQKVSSLVTNGKINNIYNHAKSFGAMSGKVSGAGGGGFMFFFVKPEKKYFLTQQLNNMNGEVVNFKFTNQGVENWISS